jgi:hypothetical protein
MASAQPDDAVHDHRLLKPTTDAAIAADDETLRNILLPMRGHIEAVHQLPTFDVKTPPRFLQASGHYPENFVLPSGLVTHLKGDAPLTAESAHVVVTHETGTGVSLFAVKNSAKLNDQVGVGVVWLW